MSTLMERVPFRPVSMVQAKPKWISDPSCVLYLPLWNISGDQFLSQDAYGHTVTRYGATATGQGGMCLTPESLIITNPSVKPIREVEIGDLVQGHDGEYHKVERVFQREWNSELLEITLWNITLPFTCSPQHHFLAIKPKLCPKRCGQLKERTRICPPSGCQYKEYKWCPKLFMDYAVAWHKAEDLEIKDYVALSYPSRDEDNPDYSPQFLELVGWYLSEGHINYKDKRLPMVVRFSLGKHEMKLAEHIANLIDAVSGKMATIKERKTALVIEVCQAALARRLSAFGVGAENKRLPNEYLYLPRHKQLSLLTGLFQGDGCSDGIRTRYVTVSVVLAYQLLQLLARQGVVASLYKIPSKPYSILGVTGQAKEKYEINISGKLSELFGKKNMEYKQHKEPTKGCIKDSFILYPIRKTKSKLYSGLMHDLQVEGCHSYNLLQASSHNSFDGVDDYLDCGNHSSLNITSDLSIVIWLQLLNYDLGGIVDKAYNTGGYMLWAHDNFTLQLYINGSLYANAVSPALNTWTQVVALASSTGCRIYQNAQPGTLGSAATPSGNSNTLTIGRDILQRYPYIFIGEISIFNRALSVQEIQTLYELTRGRYGG